MYKYRKNNASEKKQQHPNSKYPHSTMSKHTHTHTRIKYPCWQILSQQHTIQVFVQDRALSLSLQCRGKATIKKYISTKCKFTTMSNNSI